MNLARGYPELLTFDERRIYDSVHVALQFDRPHQVSPVFETVIVEAVWPFVLQHAEGKLIHLGYGWNVARQRLC